MKSIFVFLLIAALCTSARGQSAVICLSPACKQILPAFDSVFVFAQLTASQNIPVVWSQSGGPTVTIPVANSIQMVPGTTQSGFMLRNLAPGIYAFKATAGLVSVIDSVVIQPPARYLVYMTEVWSDSTRVYIPVQ